MTPDISPERLAAVTAIHDAFDGRRGCRPACVNMRRAHQALRKLEEDGFVLLAPVATDGVRS